MKDDNSIQEGAEHVAAIESAMLNVTKRAEAAIAEGESDSLTEATSNLLEEVQTLLTEYRRAVAEIAVAREGGV